MDRKESKSSNVHFCMIDGSSCIVEINAYLARIAAGLKCPIAHLRARSSNFCQSRSRIAS
jgi:hypothetical protein